MEIETVRKAVVLVFLGLNSLKDVQKREIFLPLTVLGIAAGAAYAVFSGDMPVRRAAAAGIGFSFLPVSILSGGQFGIGDSLVLIALGLVIPVEELVFVIGLSFFLSFFPALVLHLRARSEASPGGEIMKSRRAATGSADQGPGAESWGKQSLPFVPFLLAAYFFGILLW